MGDNNVKNVVTKVDELFNALAALTPNDLVDVSSQTVGLRDTNKFRLNIDLISSQEVSQLRRQLTEAIAAEKWVDGMVFAMQLMSMMSGV